MHSPFRQTALLQTTMAAQGHNLTDDCSLKTMYHSTIPLRFIWSICSGN